MVQWCVVGTFTVTTRAQSSWLTRRARGGDFYLATSGDFDLATRGYFFMATDNFPWSVLNVSATEKYSFAEQVECSASVHLSFEHLDPYVESDHADDHVLLEIDNGTEETIRAAR